MKKLSALFLASVGLVGIASAQKIDDPFRAEIGLYIPTFSGGNKNVGGEIGLGYSFYRNNGLDLAAVARGSFYHFSQFGEGANVSLGTYGVDARWQPEDQKWFVGAGLAAAESHIDLDGPFSGDVTKLGYSVEAGYDFTDTVYGVVRYQATTDDIPAYRGITVGVGFKF